MPGPNTPSAASAPIPPPFQNLPFGQVRESGQVYLSVPAIQFLQELWAALQGQGGILDILVLLFQSPAITSAQTTALINQLAAELMLLTPPAPSAAAIVKMIEDGILLAQRPSLGGNVYGPLTVAELDPNPPFNAWRTFVSDASVVALAAFGTAVVGAGTNTVPVYFDLSTTTWRVG